jgi:uncharacterized damage-inducible protein DinB
MQTMSKWLDRRFQYHPPAGEFPMILERLRGVAARVDEKAARIPALELVRRPREGWSIQEHVGHLLDLEPLWMKRVEDFLAGKDELTAADMSNARTNAAGHNQRSIAAVTAEFRVVRSRLVARLDAATDADVERTALHPRLKRPMRLIDLCFFVAEHDDHHLAIVTRLARGEIRS